jgi:O-antigen/teichoic acid export membrane protein
MRRPKDKYLAHGSQLYGAGLLILLLPSYLAQLGAEQFALMMMFFVAQGWIQITDFGFPLALSREIAIARREHRPDKIGSMLASLQLPMLMGMTLLGFAILGIGKWIAGSEKVFADASAASLSVVAVALALSLRWGSELYRTALAGAEQFAGLAVLNAFSATARLAGALVVLKYAGGGVLSWLIFQAVLSAVEMLALVLLCRRKLHMRFSRSYRESRNTLRALWPIAAQIAAASAIWISITQLDKLVLSQTLSLREYGAVGVAAAIPAGLLTLAIPLLQLSYPALVRLHDPESRREQTRLYLSLTAATCCLLFPTALICIAFSEELLMVWFSGRLDAIGSGAASLIPLYAAGAAFLALSSMPYGLLNAAGELRRHVVASLALAVCIAVALVIGSMYSDAKGAIALWCGSFGAFFLIWPQIVHHRHLEGGWWPWARTITLFALPLGIAAYALKYLQPSPSSPLLRISEFATAWIALQGIAIFMLWICHRHWMQAQQAQKLANPVS